MNLVKNIIQSNPFSAKFFLPRTQYFSELLVNVLCRSLNETDCHYYQLDSVLLTKHFLSSMECIKFVVLSLFFDIACILVSAKRQKLSRLV
jgi:hypothetical protein